jgi:4-amino-4-deoxy-L-arabinose transferase-like glycosyltransferase
MATDISNRPRQLLIGFIAFELVVMTLVPTLLSSSPPLDVVEGWTWAPHWLLGTDKHPPGPAWLLEIMHYLVPGYILGPYLLSQLAIALTYVLVYLTGQVLMDDRRAIAGTLLLAGSYYFSISTTEWNHNVLQMPVWAAIILTLACLIKKPDRMAPWLILGALIGAGMYAKYSVVVIAVIAAIACLVFAPLRGQFRTARPYLAVALSLLIFTPHVIWLFRNDFMPLTYAADRADGGKADQPLLFLLVQLTDHAAILVLLAAAGISALRDSARLDTAGEARLFLRLLTFGPALLVVVGALLSGNDLLDMWGMPMFTSIGLWLVAEFGRDWSEAMIRRLAIGATIIVVIAALVFAGQAIWSHSHRPGRTFWPMAELAAKADAVWHAEVKTPLAITGGDKWLAGLVAVGLPQRPDVAAGNSLIASPWVSPEDVRVKGMLYLSDDANPTVPSYCPIHGPVHEITLNAMVPKIRAIVCYPEPAH